MPHKNEQVDNGGVAVLQQEATQRNTTQRNTTQSRQPPQSGTAAPLPTAAQQVTSFFSVTQTPVVPLGRRERAKVAKPLTVGIEIELPNAQIGLPKAAKAGAEMPKNGTILAHSAPLEEGGWPPIKIEVEGTNRGFPSLEIISGPLTQMQQVEFWMAVGAWKSLMSQGRSSTLLELIAYYNRLLPPLSLFQMRCEASYADFTIVHASKEMIQTNQAVRFEDIGQTGKLDQKALFTAGTGAGADQYQLALSCTQRLLALMLPRAQAAAVRLPPLKQPSAVRPPGPNVAVPTPQTLMTRQTRQKERLATLQAEQGHYAGQTIEQSAALKKQEGQQLEKLQMLEHRRAIKERAISRTTPQAAAVVATPAIQSLFTSMLYQIIVYGATTAIAQPEGGGKLAFSKQRFDTLFKFSTADVLFFILTPDERITVRQIVGDWPNEFDSQMANMLLEGLMLRGPLRTAFTEHAIDVALAVLRHNLAQFEGESDEAPEVYAGLLHDVPRKEAIIKPYTDTQQKDSYVVIELRKSLLNQPMTDKYSSLKTRQIPSFFSAKKTALRGQSIKASSPPAAQSGIATQEQQPVFTDEQQRIETYRGDPRLVQNNQLIQAITQMLGLADVTEEQLVVIRARAGAQIGNPLCPNNLTLKAIAQVLGYKENIAVARGNKLWGMANEDAEVDLLLEDVSGDGLAYRLRRAPEKVGETGLEATFSDEVAVDPANILARLTAMVERKGRVNDCLINAIAQTAGIPPDKITARQIAEIRMRAGAAIGEMMNFGPREVKAILTVLGLADYAVEVTGNWQDDRVDGTNGRVIHIGREPAHFVAGKMGDGGAIKQTPLPPLQKKAAAKPIAPTLVPKQKPQPRATPALRPGQTGAKPSSIFGKPSLKKGIGPTKK